MATLVEYPLGPEAIQYIRECIKLYGQALTKHLPDCLDLDGGRVMAFLSSDVSPKQAHEFEFGGVLPESTHPPHLVYSVDTITGTSALIPIADTTWELIAHIQVFLKQGASQLCIIENWCARPSDPWLRHAKSRIMLYQEELYSVLFREDAEVQAIWNAIRDTQEMPTFIGIMTSWPEETSNLHEVKQFNANELRVLAERTEGIIMAAYDIESYLIWHKESPHTGASGVKP